MKRYAHLASTLLFLQGIFAAEPKQTPYTLLKDQATLPILTPALAKRTTLKLRLENGLEAYLISDPGVDQSAAALSVRAGSWHDPALYPGTAHFCEHMLFMGTKAYPSEAEYWQYILDNGGKINAATYSDHTTYYFSVNNDAYFGALDRFSHFFIDPLFARSGIDRELHAVDQEHAKNIEHDGWRQYMVLKETANPKHPITGFSTGNAKTLSGIPTETLKDWYNTHYSADQMNLLVISAKPLEELTQYVVSCFSEVPQRGSPAKESFEPMTSSMQQGHILYLKPIKDLKQLSLNWEVPAEFAKDNEKGVMSLIAYALSGQGENSLIQQLKRENIAESISVSQDRFGKKEVLFTIDISLTEKGISQIDTAILRTYQALGRLKQEGISKSLFEERQKLAEINYQYQSREDAFEFVMANAFDMLYEDLETFPVKSNTYTTFDPPFIDAFLSTLTPERCLYFVIADPTLVGITPDKEEKWMGVQYAVKEVEADKLTEWKEVELHPQIGVIGTNPFLPEKLTVLSSQEEASPKLIASDSMGQIYFAEDSRYHVPEAAAILNFKTPLIDGSARSAALTDLYLRAFKETLSTTIFFGKTGGLHMSYSEQNLQLSLFAQGYSDKLPLFLEELFKGNKQINPTKEQFGIYKQSLMRYYDNGSKELPFFQAQELIASLIFNDTPTSGEKYKAAQAITYEDFLQFCQNLFKQTYIQGIFYGNMEQVEAEALWKSLKTTLAATPYPLEDQKSKKVLLLPEKHGPYMVVQNTEMQGNAVLLVIEEGPFTFANRSIQQILSKALSEGFFATLRTKQQTSYIAKAWDSEVERQLLQYFGVQSSTHNPVDLLARFELFLEDFLKNIPEALSFERFEIIRKTLITSLEMAPENMYGMVRKLNTLAFDYQGDFDWIEKRVKSLEELTYEQFLEGAHTFLSRNNGKRLAVLVEGVLPKENQFRYEQIGKEDVNTLGAYVSWR